MTTQEPSPNEQEFFDVARLIPTADGRRKYLDQVCGEDQETRREVEELLTIYDRDRHFLESPPPELHGSPRPQEPISETPGDTIGPYKILEVIGEGGMGNVYMAEQAKPVRRTVALKVIKVGMDSKPLIARFEAERQALALMDHPNVAKFYDAGISTTGSPYFAMELIKGRSIVDYCRQYKLNLSEKLQLFSQVCLGVQHAHQRGIIHRDIKPSNVLVARYDDQSVAKVIDFGVAKAIGERLTDKTVFTRFGQLVGSLEYMSPEQAQLNQLDVDTRTDVYSLGAVLYELLTDEPPFQKEKLSSSSLEEALRVIREDDPLKPSDRVSSLVLNSDPRLDEGHDEGLRLDRTLRGELDWIIMKALEKDRTRRYESVSSLANDVQNYLRDQPVSACPPTITYRFGKFARRNKVVLLAASVAAVVLFLGAIGLVVSNRLISEQRDEANRQREIADENFREAREVVDKYLMAVSYDQLLEKPELHGLRRELLTLAKDYYLEFIERGANEHINLSNAYSWLAGIEELFGEEQLARDYERRAFDVSKRHYDQDPSDPLLRKNLAISYVNLAKRGGGGLQELRNAQELLALLVEEFPRDEQILKHWADLHRALGNLTGARENFMVERETYGRLLEMNPDWPEYKHYYALAIWDASGRDFNTAQEVAPLLQEVVEDAPNSPRWWRALAEVLCQTSPTDASEGELALEMCHQAVRAFQKSVALMPTHPTYLDGLQRGWMNLGDIQRKLGRWDDASKSYEKAARGQKENGGGNSRNVARSLYWVGEMQRELGNVAAAAEVYQEACELVEQLAEVKTSQNLPLNSLDAWAQILRRDWAGVLHELRRY